MTARDAVWRDPLAELPADIAFLHGVIPRAVLDGAVRDAERIETDPHQILLSQGALSVSDYYAALAVAVGARFSHFVRLETPVDPFADPIAGRTPAIAARVGMLKVAGTGGLEIAAAPRGRQVAAFVEALGGRPAAARRIFVTTPRALTDAIVACGQDKLLAMSLNGLDRLPGDKSAKTLLTRWQGVILAIVPILALIAALVYPAVALLGLTACFSLFFLGAIGLRMAAALLGMFPERPAARVALHDADLPVYTVLVPLYREAGLVGGLVEALSALDYPPHKLDIKIIAEADDAATLAALRRRELPPQFEVIVVPDAAPKTKPKALCFALALARGSLVTIYDAEDLPESDQLRHAAECLAAAPDDVACLQGRLAWYNWPESWFTRQLALEYASLFDVFLPALARFGLPLPLGGTSNHFRIEALKEAGAWDAYNVTEDADLGLRLARAGYRCQVLASTTWEEAPVTFMPWLRQRTRWLKGWIQTYLVHMRAPGDLLRALGLARFLAVQAVFGGVVVSAFVHPLFIAVIAAQVLRGDIFIDGGGPVHFAVNWLGAFNLSAGYIAGFAIAIAALRRRPMWWLVPELALLPVYWLTMSIAAVRAAWQLVRAPSFWEKTEHGVSRMEARLPGRHNNRSATSN